MKKKISMIIFFSLLIAQFGQAQINLNKTGSGISFGRGSSLYQNIKSEQFILFLKIPKLNENLNNLSYETDFNFEYIDASNKSTIIAGVVPMFRYDLDLMNANLFIKGGIGINYINRNIIASRTLGGHFIFSDMISVGSKVISSENLSVEISYLFRHISNAGIYKSNEGYNSQYLVISLII